MIQSTTFFVKGSRVSDGRQGRFLLKLRFLKLGESAHRKIYEQHWSWKWNQSWERKFTSVGKHLNATSNWVTSTKDKARQQRWNIIACNKMLRHWLWRRNENLLLNEWMKSLANSVMLMQIHFCLLHSFSSLCISSKSRNHFNANIRLLFMQIF